MKNMLDEKKCIVLIGMPAVGKSTIGVILAKLLGYRFVDSDLCIQEQENRLLKDIIKEEGIDGFLAIENQVNTGLSGRRLVIATGGSAVYGKEAMEHFYKNAVIIYLKEEFEVLERRLSNIKGRGVTLRPGQTLYELYEERIPLYEKYAHLTVEEKSEGVEETIRKIIKLLQ